MKNYSYYAFRFLSFCLCFFYFLSDAQAENSSSQLLELYEAHCRAPSDINEHIPVLRKLSLECSSVAEIGIRSIVSTWGILQGLSENSYPEKIYLGIDLQHPPLHKLQLAQQLAQDNGIQFTFWQANDMQIQIPVIDMLFIDSLHIYCHLTYELETFSPNVNKYICMHDTSHPWGNMEDGEYYGNYSEYPPSYDRSKKGLWPAVVDFLERHPEWSLFERRTNNHGFTILKRNDYDPPAILNENEGT